MAARASLEAMQRLAARRRSGAGEVDVRLSGSGSDGGAGSTVSAAGFASRASASNGEGVGSPDGVEGRSVGGAASFMGRSDQSASFVGRSDHGRMVPAAGGEWASVRSGGGEWTAAASPRRSQRGRGNVQSLDDLARSVDMAARAHGALEARHKELGAMSQAFKWTTVEARESLLQHFERVRRVLVDALDARQLTLLKQLEVAANDRQKDIAACQRTVRRAAVALSEECARCRSALDADLAGGPGADAAITAHRASTLSQSLQSRVRAAAMLPGPPALDADAFGVDVDDALLNTVTEAVADEGRVVGYNPRVTKTIVYDEAPKVETIRLCAPGTLRPLKTNKARRAYTCGYQWKSSNSGVDVFVRSIKVKLILSQGATGYAVVMSRSGERVARGSLFPSADAVNATNQHTSPTVGLRWYESHFPASALPKLSRGTYVLISVSGHGTKWLCADGGPTARNFRAVPAPTTAASRIGLSSRLSSPTSGGSRSPRGSRNIGGGGGLLLSSRHHADVKRRSAARAKSGKPTVGDGSCLRAKVRSVFHKQGQPLAPAALEQDVYHIAMTMTLKVQNKPYVRVTPADDPLAPPADHGLAPPAPAASTSSATPAPPAPPTSTPARYAADETLTRLVSPLRSASRHAAAPP